MRCAACDAELPSEARFCPSCGTPAAVRAPGVPQEERKVVTVVFCDLVGSTALSGVLDPETLRTVVLRYFERMRECLEEFGGTVEKFIGDAVMAVFGVPVTHEDDAARALAAGLAMLDAVQRLNDAELGPSLGIRIGVRIGINTGPVVTASDVSSRQALVSGETVNVAARLEQNAAEGEVLIGPESRRAAGASALTERVGPLRLKGKEDAVTAYRLVAVVEEEPEVTRRFDVPFVGRTRELALLREALGAVAARDGRGPNLVTVFGEAGMGKTRLIHEWRKRSGRAFNYGSGRCRPYGERGSLAPLADAVRQLLDEFPDLWPVRAENPRPVRELGGARCAAAGAAGPDPDTAERDEVGAALAVLSAGLLEDGTPNPSTDDTCAALTGLLGVLALSRPVVLVLDDLHWASDPLLAVVTTLRAELAAAGVLFVCAARPDLTDRRTGWGGGGARSLTLPGLTAAEAEAVADALTEVGAHWDGGRRPAGAGAGSGTLVGSPAGSARAGRGTGVPPQVLESAGGNPFYLEMLIAALTQPDSGYRPDGGGDLPTTLQALLGARIGALGRAERAALDIAAVAGREFTADEVADLVAGDPEGAPGGALHATEAPAAETELPTPVPGPVGAALARLGRHRLLRPADRPRPGTYPLRFSSGLVHEVTYQSMAKRTRAERHEHAARALSDRLAAAATSGSGTWDGGATGGGEWVGGATAGGATGVDAWDGGATAGGNAAGVGAGDGETAVGGATGSGAWVGGATVGGATGVDALDGGTAGGGTSGSDALVGGTAGGGAWVGGARVGGSTAGVGAGDGETAVGGATGGGTSGSGTSVGGNAGGGTSGSDALVGGNAGGGTWVGGTSGSGTSVGGSTAGGGADRGPSGGAQGAPPGRIRRLPSAEATAAVAWHLEHAYRYRAELGVLGAHTEELRLDAVRLLIDSGSRALARSDLAWASGLLERAVELAADGEPEWAAAARRLGDVLLATGRTDEGRALLLGVLAAADAEPRTAVRPVEAAHARLALAAVSAAPDGSSAGTVAQWALPVFESAGDDLGQARACIRIAQERQSHGRHVAADGLLSRALTHARRAGAEPERALALGAIGVSLWRGPEPVPSAVARSRALLAEHGEQRPTVRLTLNCPLAVLLALQERWDDAHACLARARRLAGELAYAEGRVVLPLFAANVAALAGESGRALDLLDEADAAAASLQADGLRGVVARESARLLLDAGRYGDAATRLARAPGTAAAEPAVGDQAASDTADLDGLQARIAAARGGAEEAEALAARAVRTAAGTDSPVLLATAWLDRADVLRQAGRADDARQAAAQGARQFEAKGHLPGARYAAGWHRVPT